MKKIKYIVVIAVIAILFLLSSRMIKSFTNSELSNICLTDSFDTKFNELDTVKLNSEFNFDKMFVCATWDRILITEAPYIHRYLIYIDSGVLLPDYDYENFSEGTYLLFFLDGNNPIGNPVEFGRSDFIFSNNFNNFNYLKLERKKAVFIYKRFAYSDFKFYTLELSNKLE